MTGVVKAEERSIYGGDDLRLRRPLIRLQYVKGICADNGARVVSSAFHRFPDHRPIISATSTATITIFLKTNQHSLNQFSDLCTGRYAAACIPSDYGERADCSR